MTSDTATEPGPPPPPPHPHPHHTARPSRSDRFFSWTAGIGVVRGDGWMGGVAAGLAARVRIDPLIVRGVLLVMGLFGFPVLVMYGLAWALLPDLDGRIPARELQRGRFTSAIAGAAAFVVIGLLPAPVALTLGYPPFWIPGLGGTGALIVFMLSVAALVAAVLIFLIVRAARRTPGETVTDLRTASAGDTAPDTSADDDASGATVEADGPVPDAAHHRVTASGIAPTLVAANADPATEPPSPAAPESSAPESPGDDSADDEMERWRAQHAAWKEQDQLWRQQQQDAVRTAREQARRERQARATAFAAEAAERRRARRAVNPRAPFAYAAAAVGLAVIVGTVAALQQADSLAPARGLFVAGVVLAVAMVLAGLARRRSGFLAFSTVLTLVAALGALAVPTVDTLRLGSYGISNLDRSEYSASNPFVQPWGDAQVYLADTGRVGETHIKKRQGATMITVKPGVEVMLDVTTRNARIIQTGSLRDADPNEPPFSAIADLDGATVQALPDSRLRYRVTLVHGAGGDDVAPATTRETVVLEQESGYVEVYLSPAEVDPANEGEQQ